MTERPGTAAPTRVNELYGYLFDGQPHLLSAPMQTWLAESRRFTSFVTTFRDKIRKKLRVIRDPETLNDLRLELETAYLLLREKTLSVVYEPEHSKQIRSPDFAVTYTTSLTFLVEVTRLHLAVPTAPDHALASPFAGDRLADTICSKLGQLLPQRANVLIIGVDGHGITQSDLQETMLRIQRQAERADAGFWQRYRFQDRTDFFRYYQRLSEILLRGAELQPDKPPVIWVNLQAKHVLHGKVRTVLYRSQTASYLE